MFATAWASALLFCFHYYLVSIVALDGNLSCGWKVRSDRRNFSLADCRAAINMIPTGTASFDPAAVSPWDRGRSNPISVHLDRLDRKHPFLLPAAFRSRTCVVLVSAHTSHPPAKGASAMYFTVWPEAKRAATRIIKECRVKKIRNIPLDPKTFKAGAFFGRTILEGHDIYYGVSVMPAPQHMPGEGWKVHFDRDTFFNVYEDDGAPYALPPGSARASWSFSPGNVPPGYVPSRGGVVYRKNRYPAYRGPTAHVDQPVTQPVHQENGPSPIDWLEANSAE
jgi:hypothetical protein